MFGYCKLINSVFLRRLAEIFNFCNLKKATEIRSLTQGKGEFAMEFLKYLPTRQEVAQKLIDAYNTEKNSTKKKKKN